MFESRTNGATPVRLRPWAANLTLMVLGLLVAPVALFALIWVCGEAGLQIARRVAGHFVGRWLGAKGTTNHRPRWMF